MPMCGHRDQARVMMSACRTVVPFTSHSSTGAVHQHCARALRYRCEYAGELLWVATGVRFPRTWVVQPWSALGKELRVVGVLRRGVDRLDAGQGEASTAGWCGLRPRSASLRRSTTLTRPALAAARHPAVVIHSVAPDRHTRPLLVRPPACVGSPPRSSRFRAPSQAEPSP